MARLVFTSQFMEDSEVIWSSRVRARLIRVLQMLETLPNAGSAQIPESISLEFGNSVRKCALNPFDIVYEYEEDTDTVTLLGLISQRGVR